jgi:hypothetical protein
MPSWRDAQLKHRDNFTFTFIEEHAAAKTVLTYKQKYQYQTPNTVPQYKPKGYRCENVTERRTEEKDDDKAAKEEAKKKFC